MYLGFEGIIFNLILDSKEDKMGVGWIISITLMLIATTRAALSTTASTTADPNTVGSEPTYILSAELMGPTYSSALSNSNSDEYKALKGKIQNACNEKYSLKFPTTFSDCRLKSLSALNTPQGSEATVGAVFHGTTAITDLPQDDFVAEILCNEKYSLKFPTTFSDCRLKSLSALNTPQGSEATVGVVFHGTTAITDLPQNDVVAQILVEALSNSTNTPNLSINPASVKVLASPVPDPITTDAPATTPAAAATNTAAPDYNYVLDIQLIGEAFSPALTNTSSKEYKALEKRILNVCGNIYRTKYPNTFSHCLLKEFRASNVTRVTETQATFMAVQDISQSSDRSNYSSHT
ncbi:hypothetical protein CgunFtcFv8_006436 [Champsocephalus gunnari]|uniref:SEA domain-containing protein n=1 Tax=Champsocephalus gunnari TaxID=52237 RepID=A0AAN8BY92_CHAGU|nr:hypothetical protein CgunFtcFv8_006436 [Champsocephalus gunnari]